MDRNEIISGIQKYESERRFRHTCSMTDMAVSLAGCYGIDADLVWRTAMLHDVARDLSADEMKSIAEQYGHRMSEFSLRYPRNMHAEIGAVIAEYRFGLKDLNALNAIRYHVSARPGMSVLEKIIFFSDFAEPSRPNHAAMQYLYRIARTDLDQAILRALRVRLDYQVSHQVPGDVCELCCAAFDFLLEESLSKTAAGKNAAYPGAEMLTEAETDKALAVILRNGLPLKSVRNIRCFGGFQGDGGRHVRPGTILRSGDLSGLTKEDADRLKDGAGLSLVIDLRTPDEAGRKPDVPIPGVRYENIPLTQTPRTAETDPPAGGPEERKPGYADRYARIEEARRMYHSISADRRSREAVRRVFRLILDEKGTVLFHSAGGTDRAGIIAALFLYALGCTQEDILCDYNASAVASLAGALQSDLLKSGDGPDPRADLEILSGVVPEVVAAGFYYIETAYASEQDMLAEAIGFDREQLCALRDKYLI